MTLKGVPKKQLMFLKISENLHFQFSHFVIPPPGDAAEKFNVGAHLHSFWYATTSKIGFKMYTLYWI